MIGQQIQENMDSSIENEYTFLLALYCKKGQDD